MRLTDGAIAVHVHSIGANEDRAGRNAQHDRAAARTGEYAIETEEDGERTVVKTRQRRSRSQRRRSKPARLPRWRERARHLHRQRRSEFGDDASRPSQRRSNSGRYERESRRRDSVARELRVRRERSAIRISTRTARGAAKPEYGNVWQPSMSYVSSDWAPYRYGRWIWVTPWGWTWVDDSPWGYRAVPLRPLDVSAATLVLGARARATSTRPMHRRLVAWVGSPSFGVHFRDVGWFPLGPREIYIPGYRSSWRYFHSVNAWNSMDNLALSNAYNGRNQNFNYRNRTAPHAVTVVNHDTFVSGHRTHGQRVDVDADDLQRWRGQGRVARDRSDRRQPARRTTHRTRTRASPGSSVDRDASSAGNEATRVAVRGRRRRTRRGTAEGLAARGRGDAIWYHPPMVRQQHRRPSGQAQPGSARQRSGVRSGKLGCRRRIRRRTEPALARHRHDAEERRSPESRRAGARGSSAARFNCGEPPRAGAGRDPAGVAQFTGPAGGTTAPGTTTAAGAPGPKSAGATRAAGATAAGAPGPADATTAGPAGRARAGSAAAAAKRAGAAGRAARSGSAAPGGAAAAFRSAGAARPA